MRADYPNHLDYRGQCGVLRGGHQSDCNFAVPSSCTHPQRGVLAQSEARVLRKDEVLGSKPRYSTQLFFFCCSCSCCFQGSGCGAESPFGAFLAARRAGVHGAHRWKNTTVKSFGKTMIGVGFEPTPPKRPVPETGALDRSAIQPARHTDVSKVEHESDRARGR